MAYISSKRLFSLLLHSHCYIGRSSLLATRSGPKTRNAPRPRVQARERAIEDHDCLIGTTKPRRMANPASGTMGLIDRISPRQAG